MYHFMFNEYIILISGSFQVKAHLKKVYPSDSKIQYKKKHCRFKIYFNAVKNQNYKFFYKVEGYKYYLQPRIRCKNIFLVAFYKS